MNKVNSKLKKTIEYNYLTIAFIVSLIITAFLTTVIILCIISSLVNLPEQGKESTFFLISSLILICEIFILGVPIYLCLKPFLRLRKIRKNYNQYKEYSTNLSAPVSQWYCNKKFLLKFNDLNGKQVEVTTDFYPSRLFEKHLCNNKYDKINVVIGYNEEANDVILIKIS